MTKLYDCTFVVDVNYVKREDFPDNNFDAWPDPYKKRIEEAIKEKEINKTLRIIECTTKAWTFDDFVAVVTVE